MVASYEEDSSKEQFCVAGNFYFQNSRKVHSLTEAFLGENIVFFAQNEPITRFSVSVHLYHCKRELGAIWSSPLGLLIWACSERFLWSDMLSFLL